MKTLIISHANCVDGWVSAYLMSLVYPDNVIIYSQYNKSLDIDYIKSKDIHAIRIVDFSLSIETIKQLNQITEDIIIYDHHETASRLYCHGMFCRCVYKKNESFLTNGLLDAYVIPNGSIFKALVVKDNCASKIVWDEYFKFSSADHVSKMSSSFYSNLELIIKYVDDYDRWTLELPNVFEINEIVRQIFSNNQKNSFEQFFSYIDKFEQDSFDDIEQHSDNKDLYKSIVRALNIVMNRNASVDYLCDNHKMINFEGYSVPFIPYKSNLVNYVGHKLGADYPFVFTYEINPSDKNVKVSLRSSKTSPINLAKMAEKYGGGGHSSAASFTINIEHFSSLLK